MTICVVPKNIVCCRVDQLDASAGEVIPEGAQPDPAWLAARRRAMHIHVSRCLLWKKSVAADAVLSCAAC